jgi:hypothetical protein
MITDVLKHESRVELIKSSDLSLRFLVPEAETSSAESWISRGWVSRKKQLIPYIMKKLEENGKT